MTSPSWVQQAEGWGGTGPSPRISPPLSPEGTVPRKRPPNPEPRNKKCVGCAKPIADLTVRDGTPKRFCGVMCFKAWGVRNPIIKECLFCNEEFEDPGHDERNRYCGKKCARDHWHIKTRDTCGCIHCPREPGENKLVSLTICRTCWKRKDSYGTCNAPNVHCKRIMRRRGFGTKGPKSYCPVHQGPDLWRAIPTSVRLLLQDAETGLFRVVYRRRYNPALTPENEGRLIRATNENREGIALVDHTPFIAREAKWAHAFKGEWDPGGKLDHVPWWIFLVDELHPLVLKSLRDVMGVCVRAGSPVFKQSLRDAEPDRSKDASDRNWERFKVKLTESGIPFSTRLRPETQDLGLEFNEPHWETFCEFVDQRALQKQEKSIWH